MPIKVFIGLWSVVLSVYIYTLVLSRPVPLLYLIIGSLTGLVVWVFFEYVMHRFLFHLRLRSRLGQSFLFIMHGNHHVSPRDRYRNLMPAVVSVPLAAGLYYLYCTIMGPLFGRPFFFGFLVWLCVVRWLALCHASVLLLEQNIEIRSAAPFTASLL